MLTSKIENLIKQGESLRVEFKRCRAALNKDIYETVRAFLNRSGGELLLGVADDGTVTGIDKSIIGHGPISPADFSPFPKNPAIAKVFKVIGRADELGSGVRKLFKYARVYSGAAGTGLGLTKLTC